MFVDGAIFIEDDVEDMPGETVEGWETAGWGLFGLDIINQVKIYLEGAWAINGRILGFGPDAVNETISGLSPKIEGDRVFIQSDEFVVGGQRVILKPAQTPRRYMQHWLCASLCRASFAQPLDLLMTYSGAYQLSVNCENFQIWR